MDGGHTEQEDRETAVDIAEIRANLLELASLLDENNLDSGLSLEDLKKRIGKSLFENEIKELSALIRNYDFDSAKQSLKKIILRLGLEWMAMRYVKG